MASSVEAFDKFRMWKKSRTVLKVTVLTKGGYPNILTGEVVSVIEETFSVGFLDPKTRKAWVNDFRDASFRLGKRSLEAERSTGELLMVEEL
ncbi:MAG TPA: hypothetical protein VGR55_06170 [Candidatus Acidoferrum sp.]|nr:hypothetical protein [Candidatus Acidoferrum sp.]HEV2488703.1 hypothetical protein [Candidatus Acidoferrales bacterium]